MIRMTTRNGIMTMSQAWRPGASGLKKKQRAATCEELSAFFYMLLTQRGRLRRELIWR
jgi:hypothetical protein